MRLSQKILLTIFFSFLATGVVAVFAYTGLYRFLETDFFSERVRSDQMVRLKRISDLVVAWNDDNLSRFDSLVRDRYFQAVYSVSQRAEDIQYRAQSVDSLLNRLAGFSGLRVVDNNGRVQYSSYAGDVALTQAGNRRQYQNWDQILATFPLPSADGNVEPRIQYDGESQQIIYLLPSVDRTFTVRGWLLAFMSPVGLVDNLVSDGSINPGAWLQVITGRGIIADIRSEQIKTAYEALEKIWPQDGIPVPFALLATGGRERYWLASEIADDGTWVGKLVPGRLLAFSPVVQALLLASVFITVALFIFLILNINQDKTEVLRSRINRLQVSLFRDWVEQHEGKKLHLSDLESRRAEVRQELRSGLGKLSETLGGEVDKIIDEGWTRIVDILAKKEVVKNSTDQQISSPAIDMNQLEGMIARAVAEVKSIEPRMSSSHKSVGKSVAVSEVADLDEVEEVADLDEAEEVADLDEAEEIADLDEAEEQEFHEMTHSSLPISTSISSMNSRELESRDTIREHPNFDSKEEVLEVLPAVLSDDFMELIEIKKVDRGKIYMFDEKFNESESSENLCDDESGEDVEELLELETIDETEPEKLEQFPTDTSMPSEESIPSAEVVLFDIGKIFSTESEHYTFSSGESEKVTGGSMESLIKTQTTGILPGSEDVETFDFHGNELQWTLTEDGLDYDRYLRGFMKGPTGIYKSLMSLSKHFEAICGVILIGTPKGLETDYAVGLDDESAKHLSATTFESVWNDWFSERKMVLVPSLYASPYRKKIWHNEYRYIRSALFIPVIYLGSQSYIFLGFKKPPVDPVARLLTLHPMG